jgi:3-phosphoshikimate 1-carboxyvinyltransferase
MSWKKTMPVTRRKSSFTAKADILPMRLLSGILAALPFQSRLTGDESLSSRPMGRVIDPLTEMGATITTEGEKPGCAPLVIQGGNLKPIDYQLKVASAQVKSCVLLAGLLSKGRTSVTQPAITRDHTERMLEFFQVTSDTTNNKISIEGGQPLRAGNFNVPGDISSAAFWLVAAAAQPGAELTIENVGLNPTRNGIVTILRMMGADITETITSGQNGEPVGTVTVKGGKLHGIAIEGELIPNIIDELPVIAVAAALAEGTTTIRGAEELRVKETDRIQAVTDNLQRMGAQLTEFPDGMEITGGVPLKGASIDSYGDHRIAMSFSIAALFAEGETTINNTDCVNTSYPGFEQQLKEIAQ